MTSLLNRIWTGDGLRKSRLHDYSGQRVGWRGLCNFPRAVVSTLICKLTGNRPAIPWIGYQGAARIAKLLTKESLVVEFGSGMSSLWFARRCQRLVSFESDAIWFAAMQQRFAVERLANVDYRGIDYRSFGTPLDDCPDRSFDFALVDGETARLQCVELSCRKVRAGGHIYLDNSDAFIEARQALLARAQHVEFITDFCPTLCTVTQGMLARLPE